MNKTPDGLGQLTGTPLRLVVFKLDSLRCAIRMESVHRILPMIEVMPLPKAPDIVRGIINHHGEVIPVVDARRRFGLPARQDALNDRILVARTKHRTIGMIADSVEGVIEAIAADWVRPEEIAPGVRYVAGVVKSSDGLVLIHDIDTFLSLDESDTLENALGEPAPVR